MKNDYKTTGIYSKNMEIAFEHFDFQSVCKPSAILRFLQNIAELHSNDIGYSVMRLKEKGMMWMLARERVFVSRPILKRGNIKVSTWLRSLKGPTWPREFTIEDDDGVVVRASSTWVTASIADRKIVKPYDIGAQNVAVKETEKVVLAPIPAAKRIGEPFEKKIGYSDLDANGHLNNVKALDILCDGANMHEMAGFYASEFQINFLAESKAGETLKVYRQDDPLVITAVGEDDTPRFTGKITLSKI